MAVDGETWVPAQDRPAENVDLRRLVAIAPKGVKRRRADTPEPEEQAAAGMEEDVPEPEAEQSGKRQKADESTYRPVSGKKWKAPGQKASTVMRPSAHTGKSWNKKMQERAAQKHLKDIKKEAVEAAKAKRKAAAEQRKAAKERKAQNQQKSAVVQKITNSATVKKMMKDKKQRKLLRTADTN